MPVILVLLRVLLGFRELPFVMLRCHRALGFRANTGVDYRSLHTSYSYPLSYC